MYQTISVWAHGENDKINVRLDSAGDYHERFFQKGDANTQMEFVKRKWRVFMFVFAAAALCVMAQIGMAPSSSFEPETISHVFCKADNKTQLECLVNVTYHNPSKADAENNFCNFSSSEWEFCGAPLLCAHYPVKRNIIRRHLPLLLLLYSLRRLVADVSGKRRP